MTMRFTKMQGAGNDYIYVDGFSETPPENPGRLAVKIADRHFGVGGDGLVLVLPSECDGADARMRMFNSDGSESEMCGNAIRCVGKLLYDRGICRENTVRIETGKGILTLELFPENGKVVRARVDMGPPILDPAEIPTTLRHGGDPTSTAPVVNEKLRLDGLAIPVCCVSMGNPHCVVFVDRLDDDWVLKVGPRIETHEAFPRRVNAEFIVVESPTELRMRVWERGTGETLACGTGACAAAVAGVLSGLSQRDVTVRLLGGELRIEWDEKSDHVFMTGPVVEVFSGEWTDEQ